MSEVSGPDTSEEGALVEAAQQGDRQAMNQLLARHWKTVDTLCRRMLRNALDAEDARQEALLQAARRISTFQGRSSFGTWIYAVTRHVCLNEIKKATRHPTTPFADQFDGSVARSAACVTTGCRCRAVQCPQTMSDASRSASISTRPCASQPGLPLGVSDVVLRRHDPRRHRHPAGYPGEHGQDQTVQRQGTIGSAVRRT